MNRKSNTKRDRIFRLILVVMSPLLFLAAIEGLLRLTSWVPSTDPLLRVDYAGKKYVITNPLFSDRFFQRASAPVLNPLMVPVNKTEGIPRIVVLGESAALGYPTPEFNLARVMDAVWQNQHPDQPIEMISLTMAGINSHVLRQLMIASMKLKPDAFVVYAGHNEAIGPFGPAAVFGRPYESMVMIRAVMWVKTWRVTRLLESAMKQVSDGSTGKEEPWYGLSEFKQARLSFDDPALEIMGRHFRENMEDMVAMANRAGVGMVLSVPSVNVSDWPPLGSSPEKVDDDTAFQYWKQGRLADLTSAWQVYKIAQKEKLAGDVRGALALYRRACDLDEYRFRADSRIRSIVAEVANTRHEKNVVLADVDAAMHDPSNPFQDQRYFFEHVHLTFRGLVVAAMTVGRALDSIVSHGSTGAWDLNEETAVSAVAANLLYTDWDELEALGAIQWLLQTPVFSEQPEFQLRMQALEKQIAQRGADASRNWPIEKINEGYRMAAQDRPGDFNLHLVAGKRNMDAGQLSPAESVLRRVLHINPYLPSAYIQLARLYLKSGNLGQAETALKKVEEIKPDDVDLVSLYGELYARKGDFEASRLYLERAVFLRPFDVDSLANLAMVYEQLGKTDQAIEAYRTICRLDDRQSFIKNNLAWLLATLPNRTSEERHEAVRLAGQAVEAAPEEYRYKGTLAVCYESIREYGRALEIGRIAIAEAMKAGDTESVRLISEKINIRPPF